MDNEDENFLPNALLFLLNLIWANRMDWYFGVDMAVYHATGVNPRVPVVPDAFLSIGVERKKAGKSRKSYAVWEENEVVPILTLEIVSHIPRGEYDEKMAIYRQLGVLYYVIYNPEFWQRDQHQAFEIYKLVDGDQHQAFEIYKLVDGNYQLQIGEPYWMPEVGLGIARYQALIGEIQQEALSWYDDQGDRYFTAEERAEQENIRAEKLAEYVRSLGIDPDYLPIE